MTKLKDRHMFLGGNTSEGFYSCFNYLLSQEEANRIICLKGGPGTGKSSLMKKLAFYFSTKGYNIEQFHCSSDDQSLDGVLIKELKVALLDGTSPHTIDPISPGAVDKIVDLANGINFSEIKNFKDDILELNSSISVKFKRAYTFLKAASIVYSDLSYLNTSTLNMNLYSKFLISLTDLVLPNCKISDLGQERHLFETAFTPNGVISYGDDLARNLNEIYILKGGPGLNKSEILESLINTAKNYGHDVECFHNPILPNKISHIIIPDLSVGVFSENEIYKTKLNGTIFNLENLCDKQELLNLKDEIDFNLSEFDILLNKALSLITEAKLLHDKLEKIYTSHIDFSYANSMYDALIKEIESFK